jgi:hypothetical protein
MTARRPEAGQAPGVVKVRLSGAAEDLEVVAEILAGYPGAGVQILDQSAPYPNRRDPGQRVHLTLRIADPQGGTS